MSTDVFHQTNDDKNGHDERQNNDCEELFGGFDRASVGFFVLIAHGDFHR